MPALYEFEGFDECQPPIGRFKDILPDYCVLSATIDEPKNTSRLYTFIQKFSSNSNQNFNHRELKRGLCMSECVKVHEKLGELAHQYKNDFGRVGGMGLQEAVTSGFNMLANVCINKKVKDSKELTTRTSVDFCITRNLTPAYDNVDYIFIGSVSLILLLVASAATYERIKTRPKVFSFFERFKRTKQLLRAFSVEQNWRKLIENDSCDLDSLSCFHASRVVIMFLFVFAQVYRHIASMPFKNPLFVEQVEY